MRRRWKYALIGSLVTAGIVGGLAVGAHRFGPRQAFAEACSGHDFGLRHHGSAGGFDRFCGAEQDAALDAAIAYLKRRIEPTLAQAAPFSRFAQAMRDAGAVMAAACTPDAEAADTANAQASLARMETTMEAALEALRDVRPAFDALYAVLDENQRKTLDDMFAHRASS